MSAADNISISALATRVGLSAATVSRVLNHRRGIGADTRRRVLEAAREAGFRPRVSVRPTTVAVVMDHVPETISSGSGFVEALVLRVAHALARHQLAVEVFTGGNLDVLPRRFADGVLAIAWEPATLAALKRLDNTPVVIFNRPEVGEFSNVIMDDAEAGRMAARHLIEHGHTRLGFLASKEDRETVERLEGFRAAVLAAGLELPPDRIGITRFLAPYSTVQRLVRSGATGMFIATETLSMEVPYLCAEAMRLSVPEELSLIGFSTASAMKFYRPPMTLIAAPVSAMADAAVKMLDELIRGPRDAPRLERLAPELVIRDSVMRLNANAS